MRLFGKYLNDRTILYLPVPYRNPDNPSSIPGFDLRTGTLTTDDAEAVTVPDPSAPPVTRHLQDGIPPSCGPVGPNCSSSWGGAGRCTTPPDSRTSTTRSAIQYLTAPPPQMRRAVDGGFLPTRAIVYEEPSVKEQAPGVVLSRDAVHNARVRPVSPYYMNLAPRISRAFNRTLRGELTGAEAVRRLAGELRTIQRRAR